MEARTRARPANEKAARSGNLCGLGSTNLSDANDTTPEGDRFKRPGRLRVMESEAEALERGAEILARSSSGDCGPAIEQLGRALELLLRKEAERTCSKLRNGRSLATLFVDEVAA